MKPRGFTIEQHDAGGLQLFCMNLDLCNIRNILFTAYPEKKHQALFNQVYKLNDTLFALRNKLDDYVCRETRAVSHLYFRGFDLDAPGLEKPLEGCPPEAFEQLMARNKDRIMLDLQKVGITPEDYPPIQKALRIASKRLSRLALALYVAYRDPKLFELTMGAFFACMELRRSILATILKTTTPEEFEATGELLTAMSMLKTDQNKKQGCRGMADGRAIQ